MTPLRLAVFVALGVFAATAFAFVVGIAWGVFSVGSQRSPETVIRYVNRLDPAPSAAPAAPSDDLTGR